MADYDLICLESTILKTLEKKSGIEDTINLDSMYNIDINENSEICKELNLESIMTIKEVC